jgi:DNA primase
LDLADRLAVGQAGRWRKVGAEWVRRCVLPDHEDKTPSFCVDPDKDVWWCHGCLRGGDAITLAQRAWDIDRADVAAAEILLTFGHEIPPRPAAWFAKQARQKPARAALEEAKVLHYQRRVFRIFAPLIEGCSDEEEKREETEYLWDAAGEIAVLVVGGSSES